MKVLRVAHHGVVAAWRERERQLRELGADVTMLSARRWNEGGRRVELDASSDTFVTGVRTVGRHPNAFLYDPVPLWRALGERPDVIDLHEEPFSLATAEVLLLRALRRRRTPFVFYSAQNIEKRYPIPFRWFEAYALKHAIGAYVCNSDAGAILSRKGMRGLCRVIPLGVDITRFAPRDRRTPSSRPVIGYVGRLEPHKGCEVLLRAVSANPSWDVRITGEGSAYSDLVALTRELGIADRVSFLGFAEDAELASRYQDLDVLAVPSLDTPGWLEQFCRSAVEAMASGVPVVASRSGALPDVVGDAGILTTPGDSSALSDGISRALNLTTWTDLRARGRERARTFTWPRIAEQHNELYRDTVGENSLGRDLTPHVVIVAYGSPDMLSNALRSLEAEFPVTIVDNSSSAETRRVADEHDAIYIDPGRNLGFGAGVNVALRWLADNGMSDRDVLLLNPDAQISAGSVRTMHALMHARPRVAAVGATQVDPTSGQQTRVWWPFPHPVRAWIEALGLGVLNRAHGFAIGSVLLLRAEAVADVGRFDERFFLYAEEVDWQKRAVDHGWSIDVAAVKAMHLGGATSESGARRERYFHASGELYLRKHFGTAGWQLYRSAIVVGAVARSAVLRSSRRQSALARLRLYLRGPAQGVSAS
ncbi:glycosyltransferase [Paramicrobacterium agarici]|uniref:D-inositol 3-phosphate glycosyltransferase n=1 Tax=Paramicrobacterium agarici TaxID=630514 RepID=A0A2A9DUS6_9MICO|nr:glycosyltransferase [Microbacterium agarici]PFG30438.1 glycosyltransferase involved in cell wall biosynthesis [Microbacterium agarici]